MNINLELYKIFYTVAQYKSISCAADMLYISQPAVSYQIKKLEEQLGTNLFIRTKHGVELTLEGKVLYEYVKNSLENIVNGENAISNMKNLDSGTLRIGVSTTICKCLLMDYINKFHELYPNIDILIDNTLSNNLLKELNNGNLDIVILFNQPEINKELNIIPFKEVHDIFVYNKKLNIKNLNDLKEYPLIFPKLTSSSRKYLNKYLKDNNCMLKPKLEVVSYNLIVELIKSNFGIGYLTKEFISEELKENKLYELDIKPKVPKRDIVIVTKSNKELNNSTKKFIEILKKH